MNTAKIKVFLITFNDCSVLFVGWMHMFPPPVEDGAFMEVHLRKAS